MKRPLKKISKIKSLAKAKSIINIITTSILIPLIILAIIGSITKGAQTPPKNLNSATGAGAGAGAVVALVTLVAFFVIMIYVLIFGAFITNIVLAILLIVSSSSIYISSKKNKAEVIEQVTAFKTPALIWSIFSLICSVLPFFILIPDIILWVKSSKKIRFLKEKIEEQEEQEEAKVKYIKK